MSSDDRPATRAFKDRFNNVKSVWKERQRGPYDRDLTEWRIEMGLCHRTAKEYWDAGETLGIIRIVFEKREKFWEYCEPDHREETTTEYMQRKSAGRKPKLSGTAKEFFERMELREKMEAGPCKHGCTLSSETDCRNCASFRNLKHKDFLEDSEGK
jgi:hypothetical protein